MKSLPVLMIVSTLVVGTAGCRQCNWFGRPSGAAITPTYSTPVMPMAPAMSPASCGPGGNCGPGNSCGSNALPVLSDAQGYAAAPTN